MYFYFLFFCLRNFILRIPNTSKIWSPAYRLKTLKYQTPLRNETRVIPKLKPSLPILLYPVVSSTLWRNWPGRSKLIPLNTDFPIFKSTMSTFIFLKVLTNLGLTTTLVLQFMSDQTAWGRSCRIAHFISSSLRLPNCKVGINWTNNFGINFTQREWENYLEPVNSWFNFGILFVKKKSGLPKKNTAMGFCLSEQ